MISFKEFTKYIQEQTLIMEAKLDDLKSKYSGKLNTSHDPIVRKSIGNTENELRHAHNNVIDTIHHADPHPKKSYTDWAIKRYSAGDFKLEDTPSLTDTLKNFDRFKSALPVEHRDLNKHKSLASLRTILRPHIERGSKSSRKDETITKGAELLHDKNGVKVYHAKTIEASCALGAGTPWCTAHQDPEFNMFDNYTKNGEKHYIIKLENEKYPHRKLGVIFEHGEFQDENNDHVVNNGAIHDLIKRNPELRNVKEFQGKLEYLTKDVKSHHRDLLLNDHNYVMRNKQKLSDSDLHHIIDHEISHPEKHEDAPGAMHTVLDLIEGHYDDPKKRVFKKEHLHKILKHHPNPIVVDNAEDILDKGLFHKT